LPVSLDCPFLIASFSGLSILDCQFLWIVHNWQSRMDNPEKLAIKNGRSRETGNQEWTIQRNWQSKIDNPEKEAIKNGQSRERGNQEFLDCQFLWIVHS
jgi:hypothetical protein